jgi:hypothetical protein
VSSLRVRIDYNLYFFHEYISLSKGQNLKVSVGNKLQEKIFVYGGGIVKVVIEDRKVCGIPVLDVYETDINGKRPIVIMLHRGNGRKEENIERAYEYVKTGFFVTLFDAYGHGELKNENDKL